MIPIAIRTTLTGAIMMPEHPVALDALLLAAYAQRENLPPMDCRDGSTIAIPKDAVPVQRSGCGRFYLSSVAQYEVEQYERKYLNKRFPLAEAQWLGDSSVKRVNLSAGKTKAYRIPQQMVHLVGDTMMWFAIGDEDKVRSLLDGVQYLGKKRSVGLGRVHTWTVEACEPWEGFPVLQEGRPLRSLPIDWPGLREHRIERRVLTPPYYERWRAEPCAV